MLKQVIINLVKNSMQALEDIEKDKKISIKVTQSDATYIIITDNGPGIQSDIINEIFIPFFTTKTSGTGIGLSLSRQIINMHGGDIQVSSIPFEETRFIIMIP